METQTETMMEGRRIYSDGLGTVCTQGCGFTAENEWGRKTHERLRHGSPIIRKKYKKRRMKRGAYKKRMNTEVSVKIAAAPMVRVNHCPSCGCNIKAIQEKLS